MDGGGDLKAPVLLLAMPQVRDPFFEHSVILLVRHDDEGSLGFIVNRPTAIKVDDILRGMEISWEGGTSVAHFGGPVQPQMGTVMYPSDLADAEMEAATEVVAGTAMTQHLGDLERLASAPPSTFRLFLGYAGWGSGQLVDEILRNDWLTAPVDDAIVFCDDAASAWEKGLRSVGVSPGSLPAWTPASDGETTN